MSVLHTPRQIELHPCCQVALFSYDAWTIVLQENFHPKFSSNILRYTVRIFDGKFQLDSSPPDRCEGP